MRVPLTVVPSTLRLANDFVERWHRHNGRTARDGGKWALAIQTEAEVVGVAIVGNPLSATFMDGVTAEVLRVCVSPDAPVNANSMMYGACRRAWFAMGGRRLITYTLTTESGVSLRAAGWTAVASIKGHNPVTWGKSPDLARRTPADVIALAKVRWETTNEKAAKRALWPLSLRDEAPALPEFEHIFERIMAVDA